MKNKPIFKFSFIILAAFSQMSVQAQNHSDVNLAGPVSPWPAIIPARINDPSGDLFIMTLGEVKTPVAQGSYDPVKDRMTLNDGTVIEHYYRDSLHVKYYSPIDKSIYPVPPSGFCTWYYYYQDINQDEVRLNTDWVAQNLIPYGAKYVQIDDGWQKEAAGGRHGSRDWTGVDTAFSRGMADMAKYIKSKGLIPGIWIAPHGQSNEKVVKDNPGVFILKPDGSSASKTWEGDWLIDPTSPQAKEYFFQLFDMMVKWGYDYYKIDGQPIVVEEYSKNSQYMFVKGGAADSLYRTTLDVIRKAIGPNRYLLGCWGLPIEGAGIMNGSRTGGDVVLGWEGFMSSLSPTMEIYFQHNILWYTDPDVMLLRQPFTLDQAQVWATLQGLTGQALMSSDRLPDLPADRVKILHSVFPATDVRPLDLFPSHKNKRIWDLKVNHLNRQYDVTGLFNFEEGKSEEIALKWKDLGIQDRRVHVFDYWNNEFMGTWDSGISLSINPTSCRVLTLLPDNGEIQLISTSRHITQGWVDLLHLDSQAKGTKISGTSLIPGGEPYILSFAYPRGQNFKISSAMAFIGKKNIPVKAVCHQGWATLEFSVNDLSEVKWNVSFEPAVSYNYTVRQPEGIEVSSAGIDAVKISWQSQYYLNAGYQVYLDSVLQGYTPGNSYTFKGLNPSRTYTATVKCVWSDGTVNSIPAWRRSENYNVAFTASSLIPSTLFLSNIEYEGTTEWLTWVISAGGKRFGNSLGMPEGSTRNYELKGLFTTFTASVCVDDSAHGNDPDTAIEFSISTDGHEIWKSSNMKKGDAPVELNIPVSGVQKLTLSVKGNSTDPWEGLPGDWIEAKLSK
jgi:hypothetical protein